MYWDGDTGGQRSMTYEELMAVGTTMLTQNRYLNPELWTDPSRWLSLPEAA